MPIYLQRSLKNKKKTSVHDVLKLELPQRKKRDLESLGEIIPDIIKVLFPLFFPL